MTTYRDITDEEWLHVVPLLPELRPRTELRGRPLTDTRAVLNGVLWVVYSGAAWSAMPSCYPSYQTCHRRFKFWYDSGTLKQVLEQLYGSVSEEMCGTIAMRMRMRIPTKSKPAKGCEVGVPLGAKAVQQAA